MLRKKRAHGKGPDLGAPCVPLRKRSFRYGALLKSEAGYLASDGRARGTRVRGTIIKYPYKLFKQKKHRNT